MKTIKKAVIPAAGFGTRFLPQTKAIPKEMMPIIDKPVIQYIAEELVEQGIETIIIVTGYHKRAIEDHFDNVFELEQKLHQSGKHSELEMVKKIADMAQFVYIRQKGPTGNATPILNAKNVIGNEPFIVVWGDEFLQANPPRLKQLIDAYEKFGSTILAGVIASSDQNFLDKIVEKPGKEHAPSDLAILGGSIYTPDIFEALEQAVNQILEGQEFIYTQAVQKLIDKGTPVYARVIQNAIHHDCGNKLEYLKTLIDYAFDHEEFGDEIKSYISTKLQNGGH